MHHFSKEIPPVTVVWQFLFADRQQLTIVMNSVTFYDACCFY